MRFYTYDLETYPNCFLFAGKFKDETSTQIFEISFRKNDKNKLINWLNELKTQPEIQMVGYNSLGFDYPIIHELLNYPYTFNEQKAYLMSQEIINSGKYGEDAVKHIIKVKDRIIPQIDLAKINHFDNKARRTSLKALQFAMRVNSLEDLPFKTGTYLTSDQIDLMIKYNIHDVEETERFLNHCVHLIEMRKKLLDQGVLDGDALNYSDVKVGKNYLVKQIGYHKCYKGGQPIQTDLKIVYIKDVILNKIQFRSSHYQEVLDWYKSKVYYPGGDSEVNDISCQRTLKGLDFYFGVGGLHASVERKKYIANEEFDIIDIDVVSWYPTLAIVNNFYPTHLGQGFVDFYKALKAQRIQYPKGTPMNAMLKLALNGVFGGSNDPFSPFYDPSYMLKVTINGQLQILQLAELMASIPGCKIIQTNTDGITCWVPKKVRHYFDLWKKWWEKETGAELESVDYSMMFIRDVNHYLAVTKDGKVKRKGDYWYPEKSSDYEGVWNKDFSAMIIPKIAEKAMIDGWNPEFSIRMFNDPFDFMLRYKTPGESKVYIGDKEMLKTVRYYVATDGQEMKKISPPRGPEGQYCRKNGITDAYYRKVLSETAPGVHNLLIHTKNKSKYEQSVTRIQSGYLVKECNHIKSFDWKVVNYNYYINEAKKLIIGESNV